MPRPSSALPSIRPPRKQVLRAAPAAAAVPADTTQRIIEAITTAIVERRLMPGTKLAEQKIADIFKVSRTIVRQALHQLSRDKLVTLEQARGARVAQPSVEEALQVFEVRHMLESAMIKRAASELTPAHIAELRAHLRKKLSGAGVSRVVIERPAKKPRVTIYAARPRWGVPPASSRQDRGSRARHTPNGHDATP